MIDFSSYESARNGAVSFLTGGGAEALVNAFNNTYDNPSWRLQHATKDDAEDNIKTGNLDYQRDLHKLQLEQQFLTEQTARNNSFNAEQARIAREENRYLASTQYQRAKQDLINSGLNPYLAYSQGGNSVGSVASASASPSASPNSSITASGQGYAQLLNTAINGMFGLASSAIGGLFGIGRAKIPNVSYSFTRRY